MALTSSNWRDGQDAVETNTTKFFPTKASVGSTVVTIKILPQEIRWRLGECLTYRSMHRFGNTERDLKNIHQDLEPWVTPTTNKKIQKWILEKYTE